MIKWTRKNPFGAHLLNLLITILIIFFAVCYFISRYGKKFDQIYIDNNLIKNIVIEASKKNIEKDSLKNE